MDLWVYRDFKVSTYHAGDLGLISSQDMPLGGNVQNNHSHFLLWLEKHLSSLDNYEIIFVDSSSNVRKAWPQAPDFYKTIRTHIKCRFVSCSRKERLHSYMYKY